LKKHELVWLESWLWPVGKCVNDNDKSFDLKTVLLLWLDASWMCP